MEAMEIGQEFIDAGHAINKVLSVLDIARSRYYYKPKANPKPRGIAKSIFTKKSDGSFVSNDQVVKDIRELLSREFVDYGYLKTMYWLRKYKKYLIDDKKVYRLMKENDLLNIAIKSKRNTKREWVKDFVPKPSQSLEYLEMDIKYMYVHGRKKNALMLTVIDVESRWVLDKIIKWNINQKDVIKLFDQIFKNYNLPSKIFVRNDNGSQFIAELVQTYFKDKNVTQEFIKPATPEQNAHIESYHSIVEKIICKEFEFETIKELQEVIDRFVDFYNDERIHSGIKYQSPKEYLKSKGIDIEKLTKNNTFEQSSEAETGSAEEQPVRINLIGRIDKEGVLLPGFPLPESILIQPEMPKKT
jgi:putative transposase